jgi:L-ribulose-5-phosphate 4-epimerase
MNEILAKQKVVDAGIRLVESGLIARTWGNVSCRISDTHFVITPSGRNYLSLSTSEIVKVAIADLSYEGSVIPSGEKGIHAEIYSHCPDVNFVIHTHQENASVLSAMGFESIPASAKYPLLGGKIICAPYALPGTKRIRQGVAKALESATGNALILKNHGAVCFGKDDEEAFLVATHLEQICEELISAQYPKPLAKKATFSSCRTANGFLVKLPGGERLEVDMRESVGIIPRDLAIHLAIYKGRKEINFIHHVASGNVLAFSLADLSLRPFVDDFAQIIGTKVKTVDDNPKSIAAALKNTCAVFMKGQGALCCGADEMDVKAVEMILEKCCKAKLCGEFFGGAKPIGWLDSRLLRNVYLKKYSKQIKS